MGLSKRERVFKALELDGEPDLVPIHLFGFEQTGLSFQAFHVKPIQADFNPYYVGEKLPI